MADLFEARARDHFRKQAPMADRMRPTTLDEFFGQHDLVGKGKFLRSMMETDRLKSLILWGPPGTGKTTLARIVAAHTGRRFVAISAVTSGVKDLKEIIKQARQTIAYEHIGTILFIDEIHRFNKAQQDALLHGVEDGTLTLIGATTENPSFEVNKALLSRCQVLVLQSLDQEALSAILSRALQDTESGLGTQNLQLDTDAQDALLQLAAGDARSLLNFLELSALLAESRNTSTLTAELVREAGGNRMILYDKTGEEHYNVISAFIKSMRASDPDAAIYYLARMLEGGEDPKFVARRLVIFASEDIGNADPNAIRLAIACKQAVEFIGMPEGYYPLSQCTLYLSLAPRSNAAGAAYGRAMQQVQEHGALPVPLHIRNAPTTLMKDLGYGRGYDYPHNHADATVHDDYLPDKIVGMQFYQPTDRGFEKRLGDILEVKRKKGKG